MGQRRPKEVLIAEDEALVRLDSVKSLTEKGFEVVGQTADDEEAIKLARELEPDLVITDVKMPGMDDITATEIISEERIVPILMFIALSQGELVERARDAGVVGYLVKPFRVSEVVPVIEVAVGRFAELRTIKEGLADLEDRLESRKIIDQAKGVLQEGLGLTEPEVFRWIRKAATDLRKSMREVAEGVVSHKRGK